MTSLTFFKNQHLFFLGSRKRIFLHIVYNHKSKAFSSLTHFPFNNKIFLLPRYPIILTSFRFMRSSAQAVKHVLNPSCNLHLSKFKQQNYVTHRIHTPKPTTSSPESLENNPVTVLHRKKGSIAIQHSEVVEEACTIPGCLHKLCVKLCAPKKEPSKAIGHVTRSDREDLGVQKLSDDDLEGNKSSPQYVKMYEKPHNTSGESTDIMSDFEKTKKLKAMLKKIEDENK